MDETSTNVAMTRHYSRARVGERACGKAPRNQGVNLTVVGAIALDGPRTMMAYEGGTTRDAFLHFVETGLAPPSIQATLSFWTICELTIQTVSNRPSRL